MLVLWILFYMEAYFHQEIKIKLKKDNCDLYGFFSCNSVYIFFFVELQGMKWQMQGKSQNYEIKSRNYLFTFFK